MQYFDHLFISNLSYDRMLLNIRLHSMLHRRECILQVEKKIFHLSRAIEIQRVSREMPSFPLEHSPRIKIGYPAIRRGTKNCVDDIDKRLVRLVDRHSLVNSRSCDQAYHKKCFKCKTCHRTLDSTLHCDGPDREIYCRGIFII